MARALKLKTPTQISERQILQNTWEQYTHTHAHAHRVNVNSPKLILRQLLQVCVFKGIIEQQRFKTTMATRRVEVVVGSREANLLINKIHTLLSRAKGKRLKT